MEDLVQFALFVGFILIWLLGTGRKKAQRPTQPPRRAPQARPRPRAAPRAAPSAGAPSRQPVATRPPPAQRRQPETLADLLRDVLQGELPDVTRVPEPEAQSLEVTVAEVPQEEAVSLETVEPAGGASHVAFHERYMDVPADQPVSAARHRYRLTPRTAREAVIWTAIFSHPKGME